MRHFIPALLVLWILAGCAPQPQPAAQSLSTPQSVAPLLAPSALDTSTAVSTGTPTPASTPLATQTNTSEPFVLVFTPVPTDTPLPTLELPTLLPNRGKLQIWDGLPTYLADSQPNYYFRLSFDPAVWALTTDQFGFPALGHRTIPSCIIAPDSGRGLPLNMTVEQDLRKIGDIKYQVSSASLNGVKQFVNYTGGDGIILTAFHVSLQDEPDQCVADTETVLATLASVPASRATPAATP